MIQDLENNAEYQRAIREQKSQEKAKVLAEALADNVNVMGGDKAFEDEFVAILTCRTHRTLQQSTAQLFLKVFEAWAKMGDDNVFDARNEDTVEAAKKIREALKDHYFRFV